MVNKTESVDDNGKRNRAATTDSRAIIEFILDLFNKDQE